MAGMSKDQSKDSRELSIAGMAVAQASVERIMDLLPHVSPTATKAYNEMRNWLTGYPDHCDLDMAAGHCRAFVEDVRSSNALFGSVGRQVEAEFRKIEAVLDARNSSRR
jgi:hypothetical protein